VADKQGDRAKAGDSTRVVGVLFLGMPNLTIYCRTAVGWVGGWWTLFLARVLEGDNLGRAIRPPFV
jgi:hypothetical protein